MTIKNYTIEEEDHVAEPEPNKVCVCGIEPEEANYCDFCQCYYCDDCFIICEGCGEQGLCKYCSFKGKFCSVECIEDEEK